MVNDLYQGMSLDPVTGLYYERARWYSPSLGTWISQDPAGYINGADTYQFVESDPVGGLIRGGCSTRAARPRLIRARLRRGRFQGPGNGRSFPRGGGKAPVASFRGLGLSSRTACRPLIGTC